ncbi:MAG TPA: sigma-70 family RNA polymerase sigma factor [Myxococcota bacterium]
MSPHLAVARYATTSAAPRPGEDLIRRHARLIERHARMIASRTGIDAEEFWSVGAMAVLDAAPRFDASAGASLETFLGHRIRGAMLDEVRRQDRLPRRLRQRVRAVVDAHDTLSREGEPSIDDVAELAGVAAEDVTSALQLAAPAVAADDIDLVDDEPSLEDFVLNGEQAEQVATAIAALPERLQLIVSLRYVEDIAQKDIARILQVSEARVSQLLRSAIEKLSASLQPLS